MSRVSNGFEFEIPSDVFFGAMIGGIALLFIAVATALVVGIVRTWQPKHRLRAATGGLLARRETPATPRTARLTPLTYRDLVAPVEQNLLVISVASAIAFSTPLLAGSFAPWANMPFGTKAAAAMFFIGALTVVALWLALPRIGRKLASTRALTGDEHALAWSGALAARIVRDLTHFTMAAAGVTAFFSFMWLGFTLPQEWEQVTGVFPNIAMFIGFAVLITGTIIVDNRKPGRHVQRTLWPQFSADGR